MKSASKAFLISLVIAIVSCIVNPNLGNLFGFVIPAYSLWFDAGFTISLFLFFLSSLQLINEEDSIEGWLFLFGLAFVFSSLVFIWQNVFGGNFILPIFYILSFVCSALTIALIFKEGAYKDLGDSLVFVAVFSGPIFAMGIYAPIVPLMMVFLAPCLVVIGCTLFFLNIENISDWMTQD